MNNPSILIALEKELLRFKRSVETRTSEKSTSQLTNKLCTLWNSYEKRIKDHHVFGEKLLEFGDFLFQKSFFKIASDHCFGRYLFAKFNNFHCMIAQEDDNILLGSFFPDINDRKDVENTIRALIGYSASASLAIIDNDPKFLNSETSARVLDMLRLMEIAIQTALKRDSHYWLVFNGTIFLHQICCVLMNNGFSQDILKYLLWACICMESSVPLMTVEHFGWRSQLYFVTCLCYLDLKADAEAEKFAQRGLEKVEELKEIERISSLEPTPESAFTFNQATLKLTLITFKRQVFENKRRTKGTMRSKIKPVLKDIIHTQWPRTGTERLLAELFRSRASQFLAVVEALKNSNRRLVQTSIAAHENEDCLDSYSELYFAGIELVAGGGGPKPPIPGKHENVISGIIGGISIMNLASSDSQSISISSIVHFIKLLYNYEQWEYFDSLILPCIEELTKFPEDKDCLIELKILNILYVMSPVNPSRIKKKMLGLKSEELESTAVINKHKVELVENLNKVASILEKAVIKEIDSELFINSYYDALVDATLFLWTKCRKFFSRINSSTFEPSKYQDKCFLHWLKLLIIVQKLMLKLDLNDIDICACGEASLKLSVILECLATHDKTINDQSGDRVFGCMSQTDQSVKSCKSPDEEIQESLLYSYFKDICSFLEIPLKSNNLLDYIKMMLGDTLKSIENSRDKIVESSSDIADNSFIDYSNSDEEEFYVLNMQAYHLEIRYQYYHVVSLLNFAKSAKSNMNSNVTKYKARDTKNPVVSEENKIQLSSTGKNDLLKSLYLLSSVEVKEKVDVEENSKMLEESYEHIQRAIQVETKIKNENQIKKEVIQAVPPPPIVLNRGNSWMVFKPAPFKPICGKPIRWYCIFLRNASGNNVKVRLNDTKYEGTGIEVPYKSDCCFTLKGLEPNEKYMAAVAAYDDSGNLIGGSIGESCHPILAAHILPCLLVYSKLCRVAYNKNIWHISKKVFSFIWNHFVEKEEQKVTEIDSAAEVYKLQDNKLKMINVENCSLITLRYFIENIFIYNDIAVKEGSLFCDKLSDNGPVIGGQLSRLSLCEKLLVAIKVSGWINDNMMCLQAVVLIYGLLAPTIYWKLPIFAALQILYHIHCVLQEIQTVFKNKKQNSTTESLRHMVCCLGYYVAKMLVHFKKKREAIDVLENTSKLIVQMNPPEGNKLIKTLIAIADDETISLSGKKVKKQKPKLKNKAGGIKSLNEALPGNMLEIRALEIYTLKLQREMMTDCNNELTGNEDVVIMNAVVSTLPIPQAYKEVVKFKRKAQFFEAFVGILGRALQEGSYENVLEWVKETMSWLTKRNEIILNKVNTNDSKGIVVNASNTDSDKLKKYSNAVVEYGRASVASTVNPNKNENDRKKSEMTNSGSVRGSVQGTNKVVGDTSKHLLPIVEGSEAGNSNVSQKGKTNDKKAMTIEEKKHKEAGLRLHGLLLDIWRTMQRRKKMRNVCFEELPWRCQMNLISADCHFQLCLNAFKIIGKQHGCPDLKNDNSLMDVNWFTLATSGALIVSWIGCMKTCENNIEPVVDIGGTTIDHKPEVHIVPSVSKQTINVKIEKKASVAKASNQRTQEQRKEEAFKQFFYHLEQTYNHYQRAIVLSHRGKNWVLLQQTCNKLLSTTHNLMITIMLLNNAIDTTMYEIPYTLSKLRTIIYNPFFLASEYLLECMNDIACNRLPNGDIEVYGNIHQNMGGSSLKHDVLDCNAYIDYGNIKRVIMFAIEVLFYQQKWERVICIIMKFNAISMGHFSESLLPILVVSQKYLFDRLNENESAINCHPSIIFDPDTGVPVNINMVSNRSMDPIEPGAHIDPVGHNLYEIPICGSKYSVVPFQYDSAYSKLVQTTNERPLYARMLEHSRKLCMTYLASKQGNFQREGKFQRLDSAVSFVASQVKPPLASPIDYKDENLETIEDIETHPLSNNFLSTVVLSYESTIDLLKDAKQDQLLAQAMHELGNIKFHSRNLKTSFKWWSCAIDTILGLSNGIRNWRDLLTNVESNSLKKFKPLLDKCGIWGCMLGSLIATKVARYIHYSHVDMQHNACLLAAAFCKSLFTSSLVHPTSYYSYVDYTIGKNNTVTQIIPGLNLFTDDHRIHSNNLLDGILWLSKHLVQFGYYLEVQPILTFAQYLSSSICQDVKSCIEVLLLKIQSLCSLGKFGYAIKYFCQIYSGKDIPKISDLTKLKVSTKLQKFNDNVFLFEERNVYIINEFLQLTLKDSHYKVYGNHLCDRILLMQGNILIEMASLINEIPDENENTDVEERSEEPLAPPPGSSQGQKNVNESIEMMQKSIREEKKVDDQIQKISDYPAKLKHKLLECSELIINDISHKYDPDKSENLEIYVNYNVLLSKICHNRFLTVSAIHHIFLCLDKFSSLSNSEDKSKTEGEKCNTRILPEDVNVHLWLQCRKILCFYLSMYDNDYQKMKSKEFFDKIGSIEDNIDNAIADCDMFNDRRSKCIFEGMAIDVEIKHGKDVANILKNLQNLKEKIINLSEKSFITKHLLIDLQKLFADLKSLHDSHAEKSVDYYLEAENLLLKELCFQGYDIDTSSRYPLFEKLNTNIIFLEDFISIKHCSYRSLAFANVENENSVSLFKEILEGIEKLFSLMEIITTDLPVQRIELLLLKGEIQRHLFESGYCEVNVCVKTYLEVIAHSKTFTCDFSTIRQCYLEISMMLFFHLKQKEDEWTQIHASRLKAIEVNNTPPATPESPTKGRRRTSIAASKQSPAVKPRKIVVPEKSSSKEMNRLGKGIWICIRAASIIAKAQQKLELLSGETFMAKETISKVEENNIPNFAYEDVLGLSSMESLKANHVGDEINWSTLLDYIFHLRRSCSYASLVIGNSNNSIVTIPRHGRMRALKLAVMTRYFESNSSLYQEDCLCHIPIDSILSIVKLSSSATRSDTSMLEEAKNVSTDLGGSTSTPFDLPSHVDGTLEGCGLRSFRSPLSIPNVKITNPLNPEKAKEFEIAIQLYLPDFRENSPDKMNLMIAANNKSAVAKSPSHQFSQVTFVRHFSVNLDKVFELHEHMVQIIAEEEALLTLQGEQQNALSSPATSKSPARRTNKGPPSPNTPAKSNSNAKTNLKRGSLKAEKGEDYQKKLGVIISLLSELINKAPAEDSFSENALDGNWNTISSLANWMNPSFGHIMKANENLFNWIMYVFGISEKQS